MVVGEVFHFFYFFLHFGLVDLGLIVVFDLLLNFQSDIEFEDGVRLESLIQRRIKEDMEYLFFTGIEDAAYKAGDFVSLLNQREAIPRNFDHEAMLLVQVNCFHE